MISTKGSGKPKQTVDVARVFLFSEASQAFEGDRAVMREKLGGKGAGLAEMTAAKVNVPPGLTVLTSCCREYYDNGKKVPDGLFDEVWEKLRQVEGVLGRKLGDKEKPLLLSVRSGAKFSMPGMMDTILNLGLNDATVEALTKLTDNAAIDFVYSWQTLGSTSTKIVFVSRRDNIFNEEIYVMNADGSGQTRLTSDAGWWSCASARQMA